MYNEATIYNQSDKSYIPSDASSTNKLVTEADLDEATAAWDAGYTPKGPASVSTLNGLSGQENGDRYVLTNGGTLTDGSVVVAAGDEVAWDATNSVWYKVNQYALEQFGTNKIKDLTNTATESDIASGNYFALDGGAGTKKLNSTTLLTKTAQNALAGNIAPLFDSTRTISNPYKLDESVVYQGKVYTFVKEHYGAWNAADVKQSVIGEVLTDKLGSVVQEIFGVDEKAYKLGSRVVGRISSGGLWTTSSIYTGTSFFIRIFGYESVEITANSNGTYYSILKDDVVTSGVSPNFATGYTNALSLGADKTTEKIKVPADARYIYVLANPNGETQDSTLPSKIIVDGYDVISGEMDGDALLKRVDDLNDIVGEGTEKSVEIEVNMGTAVQGAALKNLLVGVKAESNKFSTSSSYSRREFICKAGEKYRIFTKCYGSGTGNYKYFIHVLDSADYVTAVYADNTVDQNEFVVDTTGDDSKIIVSAFQSAANNTSKVYKVGAPNLSEGEDFLLGENEKKTRTLNVLSSESALSTTSDKFSYKVENALFGVVAGSDEDGFVDAAIDKMEANNTPTRCFNIAIITDTHQGASYMDEWNNVPYRSVEALKKIAGESLVDICVHCGDVSTSYGASSGQYRNRILSAMAQYKGLGKPLFIAKGNHDAVNNGSDPDKVEADLSSLDWDNNDYYIIEHGSLSTYVQVTEEEWNRVDTLYTTALKEDKLFDDDSFFDISNAWIDTEVVHDENNEKGCYYYKDYADYNLRVVVLNSEQVDDKKVFCSDKSVGQQLQWIAKKAFNLTDKAAPSDWHVVFIQHISIDDYLATTSKPVKTAILAIINAFKGGTSLTGSYNGYDYSFDFSAQGEGNFIANIHGHEHQYVDESDNGFNDIGFTLAARNLSTLGTKANYGLDIVSIDTSTRTIKDVIVGTEYNGTDVPDRTFTW